MLPRDIQKMRRLQAFGVMALLIGAMLFLPAFADDPTAADASAATTTTTVTTPSAGDMIANLVTQIPSLMRLVTALSYVMGMYFIFYSILKFKQFGEARTMMSQEHSLKGPIVFLFVGAMLLYFPSSVQMGLSTFFTNPSPIGYPAATGDQWSDLLQYCLYIVQFFGTIAFIRGLVILSQLSAHHAQPGTLGRGLTHIVGGIFCLNIYQFVQVILTTLGIDIQ